MKTTGKQALTLLSLAALLLTFPAEAGRNGGGSRGGGSQGSHSVGPRTSGGGGSRGGPSAGPRTSGGGGSYRGQSAGPRISGGGGSYRGQSVGPRSSSGGSSFRSTAPRSSFRYSGGTSRHGGSYYGGSRHRGRGRGYGYGYGYGFYSSPYWYLPYWSSVGWWYGSPYWGPWWGSRSIYISSRYDGVRGAGSFAVVDTDISPEEAEVWVDNVYVGTADDFDGNPDFLYLKPGKYHLEFRYGGHDTYGLDLEAKRGERVNLDKKMPRVAGRGRLDSFDPERKPMPFGRMFEPGGKPVAVEARQASRYDVDDDAERGDDAEIGDDDEDVDVRRDRVGRYDKETRQRHVEDAPAPTTVTTDKGRLRIQVTPDDAAVYLDDRLVGTADDLAANGRGIRTDAGKHTVTVTRPGYKTKTVDVEALAGKAIDVVVELEK